MDFEQYLSLEEKDFTTNILNDINFLGIDVVVTSYRQSQYMDQCLKSILSQMTIISSVTLVNHCPESSEKSKFDHAAQKYLTDSRVRVLHLDECWPGYARNIGAKIGEEDFIVFIDIDDWINRGYFQNAIVALHSTGSDFVGADCEVFNENGTLGSWNLKRLPSIKNLVATNAFPVGSVMRRSTFEALQGWNDYDIHGNRQDEAINLWRRAYLLGYLGANVQQQLIHLRRHSSNLSGSENSLITHKALKRSFKVLKNSYEAKVAKQKRIFSIPSFNGVVLKPSTFNLAKDKKTIVFLLADGTIFGAGKVTKFLIDECLGNELNVIILNCDYRSQGAPLMEAVDGIWIEFGAIVPRSLWLQTLQLWFSELQPDWIISTGHPDVDLLIHALRKRGVHWRFATTMFNTKSLHSTLIVDNSKTYDIILVESKFSFDWLKNSGVDTSNIQTITHLAHRINLNCSSEGEFERRSPGIRVGWFHRFSPEKQPSEFIKIAHRESLNNYSFVMGGTGPLRDKLVNENHSLSIRFLPESSTAQDFLNEIDISVMTSSDVEGRPLAVLEALEAGKVVLASDVGALSEMAELGYCGLILFKSIHQMAEFLESQGTLIGELVDQKILNKQTNQKISEDYAMTGRDLIEILGLI